MRRFLTVCVALAMLAAGCSNSAAPVTPAPEAPKEPVTLTMLYPKFGQNREALDEIIEQFETKHTHVRVRVKEHESWYTDPERKDNSLYEQADLGLFSNYEVNQMHKDGLIRDLSSLRLPDWDPLVNPIDGATSLKDGQRIMVPVTIQPGMYLLKEEAFQQAGIPVPGNDWTYADMAAVLAQLKAAGKETALMAPGLLEPAVRAYGGNFYNPVSGKWEVDTPEVREALTYLAGLAKDGLLLLKWDKPISIGGPDSPALTNVGSGRVPPGMLGLPAPQGPAGRFNTMNATVMTAFAHSQHPEEAMAFLQEFLGEEAQTAMARAGIRPTIASSAALQAWRDKVGDQAADLLDIALAGVYVITDRPTTPVNLSGELMPVLEGTVELGATLANLQTQLNQ